MSGFRNSVKVRVERFDPEHDPAPVFHSYEVEWEDGMNVLRLLSRIYEEIDHSLGFMGPCKIGFCELCRVNVNGDDVMACQRVITEEDKEIIIRPLSRHSVLRDLVVKPDGT